MQTFIELHLVAYFSLLLFNYLAVKMFLKTNANSWAIVFFSILFAIIKILLDFYSVAIVWQAVVVLVYVLSSNLVVHKLNHISKLVVAGFVMLVYYLCLVGINYALTTFVLRQNINYISNFYLFILIGLNFILFALFCVVTNYLKSQNPLKLTQKCELTITNLKIRLVGFVDTGNGLKEEKSGKAVAVVALDSLKKHISSQMYADLLFSSNASGQFKNIKKLQYQTISGTNFITVFKPDKFVVDGKQIDCLIGVTPKPMKYDALLFAACI